MDSTGERLRSAREAAGISLEEIASRLKRPVHQVRAVEENRFDVLGGAVYVRGFLRNYCKLLRVDSEEILKTLPDEFQNRPSIVAEHPANSLKVAASAQRRRVEVVVVAIVVVLAVSIWLFGGRDHGSEVVQPQQEAALGGGPDVRMIDLGPSTQGEESATAIVVPPTQEAPPPATPHPTPIQTQNAPIVPEEGGAPQADVTVTLRASDRCWVYIERDGQTYRDVTLFPQEDWVVMVRPGDRLTLGNAGVIQLCTSAGEWVGPLGQSQKVLRRWSLINADGSLHLPPIPPPALVIPAAVQGQLGDETLPTPEQGSSTVDSDSSER